MGGNHRNVGRHSLKRLGSVVYGADAEIAQWIATQIPGYVAGADAQALGVFKGGKLVAGVAYERFNGVHCEVSIAAKRGSGWADRKTLFRLFAYPFLQLGCMAISVTVPSSNIESLNLATKLGFQPVALVKFAAPDGSPLVVLQQERINCRWLNHGQGKQGTGAA